MQITINAHIVIHLPPNRVFARLTDIGKWPQWGGNLVSMEQISTEPLQAGSQIRQVAKIGRKPRETILEVTEYVPGQRFGIKSSSLEGAFTLEQVEAGTRLNAQFEVEATGFIVIMYKVMLKRFVMSDLRRFKNMLASTEVARV